MANMFTDTGRVEQAMPLLRQALQANPDHPEAHWELGVLQRSISSGFFPYPYLMGDPLLNSVRQEKEFDPLMAVARRRHESFKNKFL